MFFGRYFQAVFIGMGATFLSVLIGDSCVVVEIFLYLFSYWEISIRNILMEDTYVAFFRRSFFDLFSYWGSSPTRRNQAFLGQMATVK